MIKLNSTVSGQPAIAIIGAGIAGLACAIRLANKGYCVTVFEANPYPGGKLTEIAQNGYRFDAGPSLFTMPHLVDELFRLSGEKPSDYFQYQRLPITCRYFYEDGTVITAYAEKEKFAREIAKKTTVDINTVLTALQRSAFLYETLGALFMERSLHQWQTFLNKKALQAYTRLHKLDFFRTLHQANREQFSDPKVVQLFNRFATYNGSDPYQAPATMRIIPHLEFNIGAFFPKGGMHAITNSLFQLAMRLGVPFHFNARVEKILVEHKYVKGIQVSGKAYGFDKVVSNMDMVNTYKKLLSDQAQPKRLLNQPKSSSALIFYWGIKQSFEQLDLHNIFFSKNYQAEFEHIFQKQDIYEDPTVYINITSKYQPSDAPKGCENWFTMINVPNNSGQDWDALIVKARGYVLRKLSRILKSDISALIATEAILDPRMIEQKTSSAQGALYGNSSNNRYAAFLRHANFSSKIKGLYFCGGSVHPGGGIPLCLLSAKIVADMLPEYTSEKK